MINGKKIGVGIVTYNRPDGLLRLYQSLPFDVIDEFVIINDGNDFSQFDAISHTIIKNEVNLGVGKSKNKALQYLLDRKVDHFFIIEDDIYIKDKRVFEQYIFISKVTGIQHLNFSQHGHSNHDESYMPTPNLVATYKEFKLPLFGFCVGAFSYYSLQCLKKIGLMDENYYNAMEHVDHTVLAYKAGMHPPFGYFADIPDSEKYLGDDDWSEKQSTICSKDNYENIKSVAIDYFIKKHGCPPIDFMEQDQAKVIAMLKTIKGKYAKVNLFAYKR